MMASHHHGTPLIQRRFSYVALCFFLTTYSLRTIILPLVSGFSLNIRRSQIHQYQNKQRRRRMSLSRNATSKDDVGISIMAVTAENSEIDSCYAVRRTVFIEEQNVPEGIERDSKDASATHILAMAGSSKTQAEKSEMESETGMVPCGAARVIITKEPNEAGNLADDAVIVGKIGRVCVLPSHRKQGIGRKLVLFAIEQVRNSIPPGRKGKAELGAQVHALSFYESMGFQLLPHRAEYIDAGGVPHRDMEMKL